MPYSSSLNDQEISVFNTYVKEINFPHGAQIIRQGDLGDGCYIIDKGKRITHVERNTKRFIASKILDVVLEVYKKR